MLRPTPVQKRRPTPRRRLAGCPKRLCRRRPYRRGEAKELCRTHIIAAIDRAVRARVLARDGRCQVEGRAHVGGLQWAHGIRRGRMLTRWQPDNSWALCAGCHTFMANRPEAWTAWMMKRLSEERYGELLAFSLRDLDVDLVADWKQHVGA